MSLSGAMADLDPPLVKSSLCGADEPTGCSWLVSRGCAPSLAPTARRLPGSPEPVPHVPRPSPPRRTWEPSNPHCWLAAPHRSGRLSSDVPYDLEFSLPFPMDRVFFSRMQSPGSLCMSRSWRLFMGNAAHRGRYRSPPGSRAIGCWGLSGLLP